MKPEQKQALMKLRQAKGQEDAAFRIYQNAPSGFLGGIDRSCRNSALKATEKREEAQRGAIDAGVAPEVVYGDDMAIVRAMIGMERDA